MKVEVRCGLVVYRQVEVATVSSMLRFQKAFPDTVWQIQAGADVAPSRNAIAGAFLGSEDREPFLLYLDADMVFTPGQFVTLRDTLQKQPDRGAVSGHYIRWTDGRPVHNWRHKDGEWFDTEECQARTKTLSGLQEVDSFGGGFLLVTREAMEKVREDRVPPFQAGYVEGAYWGNDTWFCQQLKRLGFRPSVDLSVKLPHLGLANFSPED